MVSQLFLSKPDIIQSSEVISTKAGQTENVVAYHACLVSNYMSYLKAAGYSEFPGNISKMKRGAKRFLDKFPDPNLWLALSPEEQRRCDCKERSFIHYLFLRCVLPMPLNYLLTLRPRLFQMATRLMERDTYQLYQKSASRLGYSDIDVADQFRAVLSPMIGSQKRIDDLTLDDLESFSRELRVAYIQSAVRR